MTLESLYESELLFSDSFSALCCAVNIYLSELRFFFMNTSVLQRTVLCSEHIFKWIAFLFSWIHRYFSALCCAVSIYLSELRFFFMNTSVLVMNCLTCLVQDSLTSPPWTKSPPFHRRLQMHFLQWFFFNFNLKSLRYVPKGPTDKNLALVLNRRQAIIWPNDGIIYRRIYASLGLNELIVKVL